jgi:predicted  nucleic acid-binding Zn-ribbon protein
LEHQNAEFQKVFQDVSEQQRALEREKAAAEAAANTTAELRLRNISMAAHVQSLQARLDIQEARLAEIIRDANETVYALQTELVALRSNLDSKSRDLENLLAREEQTRTMARGREDRAADSYKKGYELLEKCLVDLDSTLKDSMQTIHDPRKKDEIGQLRRQLEKLQARHTVLEDEKKAHKETINRLESQLAGQQSASTIRSLADSNEIVRLRNELTRAEETIRQLRIQISNLKAEQGGSKVRRSLHPQAVTRITRSTPRMRFESVMVHCFDARMFREVNWCFDMTKSAAENNSLECLK